MMARRNVGAAVVRDPELDGVGILTERDVLLAIGAGQDPDVERAAEHLTSDLVFAQPHWTLEQAAEAGDPWTVPAPRGAGGERCRRHSVGARHRALLDGSAGCVRRLRRAIATAVPS